MNGLETIDYDKIIKNLQAKNKDLESQAERLRNLLEMSGNRNERMEKALREITHYEDGLSASKGLRSFQEIFEIAKSALEGQK